MTAINIEITGRHHDIETRRNVQSGSTYLDIITGNAVVTIDAHTARDIAAEVAKWAAPVVEAAQPTSGLCECCGIRPIAYSIAGECADCFSENEAAE